LPVPTCAAAIEKLRWYALRWKIAVFHKILKSACQTEKARLRNAERLVKLIAVLLARPRADPAQLRAADGSHAIG
jgi:hypothetical protein